MKESFKRDFNLAFSWFMLGVIAAGTPLGYFGTREIRGLRATVSSQKARILSFSPVVPKDGENPAKEVPEAHVPLNRDDLLIRTNEERLKQGLQQLGESSDLDEAAQIRADEVAAANYCSHDGFRDRREKQQYPFTFAGENLACGVKTAKDTVDGFMASPTHRDQILSQKVQSLGIGIRDDVVVLLFAASKDLRK